MFGYVKVCKPELRVREYEEYKAVYCTLCKTLGKEYGVLSRVLLRYDATFYVLLRECALQAAMPCYKKGRCRFNPPTAGVLKKLPRACVSPFCAGNIKKQKKNIRFLPNKLKRQCKSKRRWKRKIVLPQTARQNRPQRRWK